MNLLSRSRCAALLAAVLVLPLAASCDDGHDHGGAADAWKDVKGLVAVVHPTAGNQCKGVVRFTPVSDGVKVVADVEGLTANQKHAFHVHEFGDCTAPDAKSAGSHYNPEGHQHGDPAKDEKRHAGDLGNLQADAEGKAHLEITVHNASLTGKNALIGRSVIVHAKPDDFSQPVGNAGDRIGCGVIGIASK